MNIRIKTFAVLKSYFEEEFEIQIENKSNIVDVMERLEKINPKAQHVLSHSLIAINDEMVDRSRTLNEGEIICILPPVSGG
mgnify:CR=1 FL=1